LLVTINRRRRQTTITTQPAPSDSRSTPWSGYRSLPDPVDLTDEELREALQTTMLRILRIPS